MSSASDSRPRKGHPVQFDAQPDPLPCSPAEDHELRFTIEAAQGGKRLIDFRDLTPTSLARLFAEALKRAVGLGGSIGAITTVLQYQNAIRKFFIFLAESCDGIAHPSDLRSEHIDGFEAWLECRGLQPLHRHGVLSKPINCLRLVDADFPHLLHKGLCERLRYVSAQPLGRSRPRDAYSPFVARQLRGAARADIAFIRARIENPVEVDASIAQEWEVVDNLIKSQGTVSHKHLALGALYRARYRRGIPTRTLIEDLHGKHYLLASDIVPFLVLLSLETGLEIECCKGLTVDCLRNPGAKTIEITYVKRRARGSEWKRLHVRDEGPLSPGGLIRTVVQLTAAARRHSPSESLWVYFDHGTLVSGIRHPRERLDTWIAAHGITDDEGTPLYLVLSRLRKTQKALWYIKTEGEIHDFAIGHTLEVAARHYADIPALRHVHEKAVADGLGDAFDSALKACVLTPEQEEQLRQVPDADHDVSFERFATALDGEHDVWLASCSDFYKSPFGDAGQPCPQPFWGCFECQNAVITARKLPAILLFLEFINEQRATLSASHWSAKFGRVWTRITTQILPAFPAAVVEDAHHKKAALEPVFYLPPEAALA
jgi:hypothetical protein